MVAGSYHEPVAPSSTGANICDVFANGERVFSHRKFSDFYYDERPARTEPAVCYHEHLVLQDATAGFDVLVSPHCVVVVLICKDAFGRVGDLVHAHAGRGHRRARTGGTHARAHGRKVSDPDSSGFFLGRALAERYGTRHVVAQTDLSRRPTKTLLSVTIQPNDRVVLANDVASTGASLDPLRQLVAECGGLAVGLVLFAVVGDGIKDYCASWQLPSHWLVTARWQTYAPDACSGCQAGEPLIPVAEFV